MFIDKLRLTLIAGKGGDGIVSWRREKYIPKGGPAGGDGGAGGSITIEASPQIFTLQNLRNRRTIAAQNGHNGGSALKKGKNGESISLQVPCGTLIKDSETGEILLDLTDPFVKHTLCSGGKGGKGNARFRTSTNQAPNTATPGTLGESKEIELELKLIADAGLVGIPNAGKSSLLSSITSLPAKIGAYPFTTLHPNLSYIQYPNDERVLIADIPGIIEDAHLNKGLGLEFLRHIERTSLLIFVIDASGVEGRDPADDFFLLQRELANYDPALLEKPTIVVLNKMDLEEAKEFARSFKKKISHLPIFEISTVEKTGLEELKNHLRKYVQK